MKLDIVLYGNSNHTGYGTHLRGMLKALSERNYNIALVPIQTGYQIVDTPEIQKALDNRVFVTGREPSLMIYHTGNMAQFVGSPRLGFAIFETDVIPILDVVYLNTLDFILVPSEWGKTVLIKNKVTRSKIYVVPEGFDGEVFYE